MIILQAPHFNELNIKINEIKNSAVPSIDSFVEFGTSYLINYTILQKSFVSMKTETEVLFNISNKINSHLSPKQTIVK